MSKWQKAFFEFNYLYSSSNGLSCLRWRANLVSRLNARVYVEYFSLCPVLRYTCWHHVVCTSQYEDIY